MLYNILVERNLSEQRLGSLGMFISVAVKLKLDLSFINKMEQCFLYILVFRTCNTDRHWCQQYILNICYSCYECYVMNVMTSDLFLFIVCYTAFLTFACLFV